MNHKLLFFVTILCQMTITSFAMEQKKTNLPPELKIECPGKLTTHYGFIINKEHQPVDYRTLTKLESEGCKVKKEKWIFTDVGTRNRLTDYVTSDTPLVELEEFSLTFNQKNKPELSLWTKSKKTTHIPYNASAGSGEKLLICPIQTQSLIKLRKKINLCTDKEALIESACIIFFCESKHSAYSAIPVKRLLNALDTLEKNIEISKDRDGQYLPIIHTLNQQISQLNEIIQSSQKSFTELVANLNSKITALERSKEQLRIDNNRFESLTKLSHANQRSNRIITGLSTLSFFLFIALLYKSVDFTPLRAQL